MSKNKRLIIIIAGVLLVLIATRQCASFLSNQVLDSFRLVSSGLDTASKSREYFNDSVYSIITDTGSKNLLLSIRLKTASQIQHIEFFKSEIIRLSGGIDSATGELKGRDDIDAPTKYFVEQHFGDTLQYELLGFEKALVDLSVDDSCRHKIENNFSWLHTEHTGNNWSIKTFDHVPAVAAVTILAKLENDCVSNEGIVLEEAFKKQH